MAKNSKSGSANDKERVTFNLPAAGAVAAAGIGSAAIVAALLYWRSQKAKAEVSDPPPSSIDYTD